MVWSYVKLCIAALIPVAAAVIFEVLERFTPFKKFNKWIKQVIFGLTFGGLAILGSEWGIPIQQGYLVNCRDAAVLVGGLFFGWPAGLIAGTIGALERFFIGSGDFTRIACSVSTFIAGVYAGVLSKFLFKNKRPNILASFFIGLTMETFHLLMVFVTNATEPQRAFNVVQTCFFPMIISNAVSVLLSSFFLTLMEKGKAMFKIKKERSVYFKLSIALFSLVAVAFVITTVFLFYYYDTSAYVQTKTTLNNAIVEAGDDLEDKVDYTLIIASTNVKKDLEEGKSLSEIKESRQITEINLVNRNGILYKSTDVFVPYDVFKNEEAFKYYYQIVLNEKESFTTPFGVSPYYTDLTYRKYAAVAYEGGYVQIGLDQEAFQKIVDIDVRDLTANSHVGNSGSVTIMDGLYNIVSTRKGLDVNKIKEAITKCWKDSNVPGEIFYISYPIDGVETAFCCMFDVTEGYYITSAISSDEAYLTRNTTFFINTFLEILVFTLIFILVYVNISKLIVNKVENINTSLKEITNGNLNVTLSTKDTKEFNDLSRGINATVDALKNSIIEEKNRNERELAFAKNIQSSVIPSTFPAFPRRKDFDIYASMVPAREVGGDFYDFYLTHHNIFNFNIADVSGKGIPAAMFMMRAKTELRSLTEAGVEIKEVFNRSNDALYEGNDQGMFVTAWQAKVDLENGLVSFVNAGHNPPLIKHKDGKFEFIKQNKNFVLAGFPSLTYKIDNIKLLPGDIIFLYTDGITEATNSNNELYGESRLLDTLNRREYESCKDVIDSIKENVDEFVGEAIQFDDMTMLCFKYNGTTTSTTSIKFSEASLDDIPSISKFVNNELSKANCSSKVINQIDIAIDEIYSNICKYSYPDKKGPTKIELVFDNMENTIELSFKDNGVEYNPLTHADPDVTLKAEDRDIGGLGIYMIKNMMDSVTYRYEKGSNILTVMKKLD